MIIGFALQEKCRERERTCEAFETIGLGVVIARCAVNFEIGAARMHQRRQRVEELSCGELPVEIGCGERHFGGRQRQSLRHHAVVVRR